jgi:hypothetical protein
MGQLDSTCTAPTMMVHTMVMMLNGMEKSGVGKGSSRPPMYTASGECERQSECESESEW